jgi:hypothetical protein
MERDTARPISIPFFFVVTKASKIKAHTGTKYDGQIYYPTILTDVPLDAAIANEETFKSFHGNSVQHELKKTNEKRGPSNVDQLERCASGAFAEHVEPHSSQTTHDAGCDVRFIELRQP